MRKVIAGQVFATIIALVIIVTGCASPAPPVKSAGDYYYPPLTGEVWETVIPASLGWDADKLAGLLRYVEEQNSTAFLILHKGKLVVERYWRGWDIHTSAQIHSAGKSVLSFVTGIAQEKKQVNINDKATKYLGNGWSKAPVEKENLITIKHLLTMSSGLTGDGLPGRDDLQYEADAGTKFRYNTSAFYQIAHVLEEATGVGLGGLNQYIGEVLWSKIGTQDSVWNFVAMSSSARDMARFGLMILGNGTWAGKDIIKDKSYLKESFTPSPLNAQYGYLWWLGKDPDTMSALGMGDKVITIIPDRDIVLVRHGEAANDKNFKAEMMRLFGEVLPQE